MGVDTAFSMAITGETGIRMATVDNWQELLPYITSYTQAGEGNRCGIKDWKSTSLGYGYQPGVFPGDSFTFTWSLDGTNGYTGTGYCEQIDIIVDVEGGRYVENAVHASRNGALSPGAAEATDTTAADPPCSESLPVKLDSTAQDDVRYMHLMIRCKGRPYVTSDTAGGRLRRRGPISAQLTYRVYNIDPSELPVKGTKYLVNVMTTATLSWELKWMRCERVRHFGDCEKEENVNAEVVMKFTSNDGTNMGYIKNPATATKWPFS